MTTLEIILSVMTTLLGGANVAQLVQLRSIRRKGAEEANQANSESWRLIVDGNVKEIARLQERLDAADRKVAELTEIVYELRIKIANDEMVFNSGNNGRRAGRLRGTKNGDAGAAEQHGDGERNKGKCNG